MLTNEDQQVLENSMQSRNSRSVGKSNIRDSAAFFNSTLLTTGNNGNREKGVMIICGPNAAPYEIFSYTDKWVDYYLDNGINVFVWNYRGYGDSTGKVNFENMRSDSELIVHHLKKELKFSNIGVHGISLGGIAACHLAG